MRKDDLLSGRQIMSIASLIILGEAVILGGYTMPKTGSWISLLITIIFSFLIYFIYSYILSKFPNMDIYDIFLKIFGKIIGKIFILIFAIFCLGVSILTLKTMIVFITRLTFMETPGIALGIGFITFTFVILRHGIEVFGRIMTIIYQLLVIMIIIFIILLFPKFDFMNLLPIMASPFSEVIRGSIYNFLIISGDLVVLMGLKVNMKKDKYVHYKSFFTANSIAGLIFIIITISTVATLGLPLAHIVHYPTYLSFSIINIANVILRIEVILSTFLLTASICKYAVFLDVSAKGIQKFFGKKEELKFILPLSIISLFFSIEVVRNLYAVEQIRANYYWIKGAFQVIIPITLAIIIFFMKEKTKSKIKVADSLKYK